MSAIRSPMRCSGPPCACGLIHRPRRVVLTGGPAAGKTAVLELVRRHFCEHVDVLPESAGIVYGGGFPRVTELEAHKCAQRAIFHVQHELEALADSIRPAALVVCDRGTIDGLAYWPGDPEELMSQVGSTREREMARYDAVIHLRTPPAGEGYNYRNVLRVETPEQAAAIDRRIEAMWSGHPRRFFIPASSDFLEKAESAIALLAAELPECCRRHVDTNLRDDAVA